MKNRLRSTALTLFLSFFVLPGLLACFPRQALAFAGGAGTSGDPYQITTAAELASVSSYLGVGNSGKYFKVMNDIDLNVSPYNTGTGWTPIGKIAMPFTASLMEILRQFLTYISTIHPAVMPDSLAIPIAPLLSKTCC